MDKVPIFSASLATEFSAVSQGCTSIALVRPSKKKNLKYKLFNVVNKNMKSIFFLRDLFFRQNINNIVNVNIFMFYINKDKNLP